MPHKGYRQKKSHRRKVSEAVSAYHARVQAAFAQVDQRRPNRKFVHRTNPTHTPVPPSASSIKGLAFQRWAVYSYNGEGRYYYKREQADTFKELQHAITDAGLTPPLWTYVKSGHTEADIGIMPIRVAEDAVHGLGHRFQKMRRKE